MTRIGIITTSALFLVVGLTAPAYAQNDDHKDGGKPAQDQQAKPEQQEHSQQSAPEQQHAQQPQESRPADQEHTQQAQQSKPAEQQHTEQAKQTKPVQQQHTQQAQQSKPVQQHTQQAQESKPAQQHTEQAKQTKPAEQQHTQQAQQSRPAQHQAPQRSVAQQQHQRSMPELRLSARGSGRIPDDRFHANFGQTHVFVIREPVMVGGYSRFQYGGFWFGFVQPWPVEWYYTDDVYVDYIDGGYYLCNPYYPGARVSISVVI
jgi:hypothetical protein